MLAHLLSQDGEWLCCELPRLSPLLCCPDMPQALVARDIPFDRAETNGIFRCDPRWFVAVFPTAYHPFPQILRISHQAACFFFFLLS